MKIKIRKTDFGKCDLCSNNNNVKILDLLNEKRLENSIWLCQQCRVDLAYTLLKDLRKEGVNFYED